MTTATATTACPVFILPGALNACAEDAGRALAAMLLSQRRAGLPGPVVVAEGAGLVDFREAITEALEGREPCAGMLDDRTITKLLGCSAWTAVAEAADGGCLFVEVADSDMPAPDLAALMIARGCGLLVRCANGQAMLDIASRYAAAPHTYLQVGDNDEPLRILIEARLHQPKTRLTISNQPLSLACLLRQL